MSEETEHATSPANAGLRREFMVERQGRWFALYQGLLDLAHQKGLVGIETQLIQVPSPENGEVAICTARVTLDEGGKVKSFTGIGDAAPNNVAKIMTPHILRMAETRAKARALRDATNVGVAALEELAEEPGEGERSQVQRESRPAQARPPAPSAPPQANRPLPPPNGGTAHHSDGATPNQIRMIYGAARDQRQLDEAQVDEISAALYGNVPASISKKQASDFIQLIQSGEVFQVVQQSQSGVLPAVDPPVNNPAYQTWHRNIENAKSRKTIESIMEQVNALSQQGKLSSDAFNALQVEAIRREQELGQ